MFRVKLALIVIGGFVAFMGFEEFKVSSGASAEPVDVELASLEKGGELPNVHARITKHIAVYAGSVYEYEQGKYESGPPGAGSKVNHCYYPILSAEHPFIEALANDNPDADLDNFAVIIKTERFATVGSIPDGFDAVESIQGLVVNRITSLDSEEQDLVRQSFPNVDLNKLLILEDGRAPASIAKSGGMMAGGGLLSLVGLGLLFGIGGRKEEAPTAEV